MAYTEPEWAKTPTSEWLLTEIKGGIEVQRYPLHVRPTTIFGRATDMVHIPLNHESASRQHARISFDMQGLPWLRDLKSTHGTTCNKRRLPPLGKIESNSTKKGSRGIMLFPGDILGFGASTRIYCLEGPPEFERGAINAKMQQAAHRKPEEPTQASGDSKTTTKKEAESVSWGISMDDEDEDNEEGPSSTNKTLPMDMQVPEKHRKAFDRLNALKYKLSNLETEDGRIRRKGELSQGQENQLQRNSERENSLKQSIVQLEEELYDKIYPDKAGSKKRELKSLLQNMNDEEDDDFFDRTKKEKSDVLESEESEKTLVAKWKKLYQQKSHQETNALPVAKRNASSLSEKLSHLEATGDEEAFFVKNDLALANEALDKILAEQSDTTSTMKEIEKLLKIVNPNIQTDKGTGYIGEGSPPAEEKQTQTDVPTVQTMLPPPIRAVAKKREAPADSEHFTMPPPMMRGPSKPNRAVAATSDDQQSCQVMPPPKRKRVAGPPEMPPPPISAAPKPAPTKPQGTLSFLTSMTKPTNQTSLDSSDAKESKKPVVDPKNDVWRAPEGQDGSGITKLNAKFAGRY